MDPAYAYREKRIYTVRFLETPTPTATASAARESTSEDELALYTKAGSR